MIRIGKASFKNKSSTIQLVVLLLCITYDLLAQTVLANHMTATGDVCHVTYADSEAPDQLTHIDV